MCYYYSPINCSILRGFQYQQKKWRRITVKFEFIFNIGKGKNDHVETIWFENRFKMFMFIFY